MRTLLTAQFDTEATNKLIADGELGKLLEDLMDKIKPESAYFTTRDGCRCAYIVFDLQEPSQLIPISEPLFMGPHAKLTYEPAMNADDVRNGLGAWASS